MQQLKKHKKALQRQMMTPGYTQTVRKQLWQTCKAISNMKKQKKKKNKMRTTSLQEGLFRKNSWEFSKSVCRGEFGNENLFLTFSNEKADQRYTSNYSTEKTQTLKIYTGIQRLRLVLKIPISVLSICPPFALEMSQVFSKMPFTNQVQVLSEFHFEFYIISQTHTMSWPHFSIRFLQLMQFQPSEEKVS